MIFAVVEFFKEFLLLSCIQPCKLNDLSVAAEVHGSSCNIAVAISHIVDLLHITFHQVAGLPIWAEVFIWLAFHMPSSAWYSMRSAKIKFLLSPNLVARFVMYIWSDSNSLASRLLHLYLGSNYACRKWIGFNRSFFRSFNWLWTFVVSSYFNNDKLLSINSFWKCFSKSWNIWGISLITDSSPSSFFIQSRTNSNSLIVFSICIQNSNGSISVRVKLFSYAVPTGDIANDCKLCLFFWILWRQNSCEPHLVVPGNFNVVVTLLGPSTDFCISWNFADKGWDFFTSLTKDEHFLKRSATVVWVAMSLTIKFKNVQHSHRHSLQHTFFPKVSRIFGILMHYQLLHW